MIEKFVYIETPAGRMDSFVAHPPGMPCPAVVVFMDIWGLREELFEIARRVAAAGYYCVLPNTYYRGGKVRFEYRNEKGEMRSMESLPWPVQETVRTQMQALTDAMVVKDMRSVLDFLALEPALPGPKGVIGYCMGGRHALSVAGHYPDEFRATASLHGTRLVTDAKASPHHLVDRFRGEIYCGFAERDSLAPPSTIETLTTLLASRSKVRYHYAVHLGTEHGYSLPDRDIYHAPAAERDWEMIFAILARQLTPAVTGSVAPSTVTGQTARGLSLGDGTVRLPLREKF
jgi:carboxymethylenebutenolidase